MLNGFPVERKKLSQLTKAPYNPRKISDEQAKALQRSLEAFGVVEPIIWNKQTGHIVGGHQRLDALLALGEKETDVIVLDLPEEKEQVLNLALNKISGEWDTRQLIELFNQLGDIDIDLSLTGFSEEEIKSYISTTEVKVCCFLR